MKKVLLALVLLGGSTAALAVEVHGSVGVDSKYIGYGVNQNPGKAASLNGAVNVDLGNGFGIESSARQVTINNANMKEVLSAAYKNKFAGFGFKANLGHAHYDGGNLTPDYNYGLVQLDRAGFYGMEEHRKGTRSSRADADFVTVGYKHDFTPRLQLGAEATERRYVAEGKWRFNDVALYGKYKMTPHLDAVATLAHGGTTDLDRDIPGVSSIGVRYNF